jgi:hypothetical protein
MGKALKPRINLLSFIVGQHPARGAGGNRG